jgi:hypothetical protein
VISVNKGRRSIGFASHRAPCELRTIDEGLFDAFSLRRYANDFDISTWYQKLLVVGRSDVKRLAPAPSPQGSDDA